MKNLLQRSVQREAYEIVYWQLSGIALFTLFASLVSKPTTALAVLSGGLAYGLPNLIFVWRVFRFVGANEMTRFISAFFIGEMLKLIVSGVLVVMIVNYLPVNVASVVIGFVGAIIAFWIACFIHFSKQARNRKVNSKGVVG